MHTPSDGRLDERLIAQLRRATWMDEVGRTAKTFKIVDVLDFDGSTGSASLLIVAPDSRPARWYAVRLGELDQPSGDADSGGDVLDALVIGGMRRERRITTRRGGTVLFRGDPPPFQGSITFDPGWSSNALSMVSLGGAPHIHKRYRVLTSGVHEPEILRRLHGTQCLPDYAGDYAYVGRDGERRALGVAYRYVAGQPIEDLLRANLRTLWAALPAGRPDPTAIRDHVRHAAPVLAAAGSAIHRLHQALAAHVATGATYTVEPHVARMHGLLRAVSRELLADDTHPTAVRTAITTAMTRAVSTVPAVVAGSVTPSYASGISHGDLHLSHLICQGAPDGMWTVRAIDVSSAAVDPHDPGFADQSPWQDLVAVQRGLESFATHEAAVESARILGTPRNAICHAAVHDALPDAAGRDEQPHAREVRQRLFGAADLWSRLTLKLVLDGYRDGAARFVDHPIWRLLYLHRLLHELGYNYAHRRNYQVNVDLRYAAALGEPDKSGLR